MDLPTFCTGLTTAFCTGLVIEVIGLLILFPMSLKKLMNLTPDKSKEFFYIKTQMESNKDELLLAAGTYGEVYKMFLPPFGFVIKKVSKAGFAPYLRKEMIAYLILYNSPGVPKVLGSSFDLNEGESHLLLEYIENTQNLAEVLAQQVPVSSQTVSSIFRQIFRILKDVHHYGIMHCDLKPANILYQYGTKNIYIIDFGLFHFNDRRKTWPMQTEEYRAPEVFAYEKDRRTPVDVKMDMYSVGMILVEFCFGSELIRVWLREGKPRDKVDWNEYHRKCRSFISSFSEKETAFLILLKGLLEEDPKKRFSPAQALEHLGKQQEEDPQ